VKWLLIGSIGGSVLTAGVLAVRGGEGPQRTLAPIEAPRHSSPATGGHPDERRADPPLAAPATAAKRPPRKTSPHEVVSQQPRREAGPPRSGLAAEVSRLDAARVAIARGAYDDALRLIAGFHEDFPGGALAAEADVVALEALAGKGDHAEVARRTQSFLTKHPNDPHAARVRWLAAQAAAR
jgi:TolA-binding protein